MSDILIKNMKMPTSCFQCDLKYIDDHFRDERCIITDEIIPNIGRDVDCPLVEIKPHGDLIDRDAIPWRNANHPTAGKWIDEAHIRIMPTIIEAEGKDINVLGKEEGET